MSPIALLLAGTEPEQSQQILSAWEDLGCDRQDLLQADTGQRAQGIFQAYHPGLLVLGEGLPDMPARELFSRIKGLDSQFPVCLLLTSKASILRQELQQEFQLDLDDVLLAPLDTGELALRLQLGLQKARQKQIRPRFQDLAVRTGLAYWEYVLHQDRFYPAQELCSLLGYAPDEHGPGDCNLLRAHFAEQDVQELQRNLQALAPGDCFELELTCRRLDREQRYIRIQGQRDPKQALVAGLFQDITQQKRVQNKLIELLEHSSMQAAALEQSGEGIVLTDQDFRVVYVNPFFDQVCGFKASELICNLPDRQRSTGLQIQESGADHSWRGQLSLEDKNGMLRQVEVTVSAVRNWSAQIVNYVLLVRDVTEKLHLQQQLQQAQKMEAIGTLAGGIAHDFNNMLMAMQGFTELAQSSLSQDSKAAQHLQSVLQTCERAKDLVQQILTFSRQEQSQKKPLQVKTVLKEVLKLMQATLPANIELQTSIDPDPPRVLADPSQMQQVIMNLCTNAVQAMPEGGRLQVALRGKRLGLEDEQRPEELEPGHYLELEVQDTGQGMEQELTQRIFDPFFTTKPRGQGTGLGLSVVHGILQEVSGSITVRSTPGAGTLFRVHVPALQNPRLGTDQEQKQDKGVVPGRGDILLVDDQQDIVRWGIRALEGLGYRVFGTSDSTKALQLIDQDASELDLVVTDLSMPGVSGLELLQRLKERRPELPVILCTGYSSEQTAGSQAMEQADAVLYKPFSIAEFSRLVRSLIMRSNKELTT
ncbi:MAG: response regulator [Desulfohalobiaceae bacterium]